MSNIDDTKKRNLIWLFNHYITTIKQHKNILDEKLTYTSSDELIVLCQKAIDEYDMFFDLDKDNSKVNRWLGYVQGVLISVGYLTVDDERDFTRPYLTAHRIVNNKCE